jgi:hypothetical protein
MDVRQEINQETVDNYFYEEFKSILLKIDINEYPNAANKVIQLLTEAIQRYQNTDALNNDSITFVIPQDKKNKLDEIILFLAKELDKGYNLYLPFSEKSESDEIDEYLTLEAGRIIRQAKCILQDIKEEIEKERKWMSNPRADERRRNYR